MADIFISYKREDRARIEPLARALEARGYTVWWDLELVPSQKFERQIKRELDLARCVIVVWTDHAIGDDGMYLSEWMQTEANSGDQRGILLPVQIDAGRVHWRHGQSQFASLLNWDSSESAQGFVDLIKGVTLHVGTRDRPINEELEAWHAAEEAQTPESFRQFLDHFPQSRFAGIARSRVFELEEMAAWRALGLTPTVSGLAIFMRRYPGGRYADEAEAKIYSLENESLRAPKGEWPSRSFGIKKAWMIAAAGAVLLAFAAIVWRGELFSSGAPTQTETAATNVAPASVGTNPASTSSLASGAREEPETRVVDVFYDSARVTNLEGISAVGLTATWHNVLTIHRLPSANAQATGVVQPYTPFFIAGRIVDTNWYMISERVREGDTQAYMVVGYVNLPEVRATQRSVEVHDVPASLAEGNVRAVMDCEQSACRGPEGALISSGN